MSWFSDASEALSGVSGSGKIVDGNGSVIGSYKAIGGFITAWFTLQDTGSPQSIQLPQGTAPGPCFLSDGSTVWPDDTYQIIANPAQVVNGWVTYRG